MFKRIQADIKTAMMNKDTDKKEVLKMVSSKAQLDAKEKKKEMSDEIVVTALKRELKQLIQTKESLKGYEESDLYQSTVNKISIVSNYLPAEMSEEEINQEVRRILSSGNYPNFGLKMKAVMTELKGKADNSLIKKAVENYK